MPNKQWPQGTPGASVPLTDAVEFGTYNSAETGATKNVKYTALEIKTYAEGTLSADIAQNASNISDNTAAIGVNTGLINDNTIEISGNDSRLNVIEGRVNQGVKTTDSPTFVNAAIGGHDVDAELDSLNSDVSTLNSRVNQGVKTTDSPVFAGVTLNGPLYPRSGSRVSISVQGNSTTVIPRGVYMAQSSTLVNIVLEIEVSPSTWFPVNTVGTKFNGGAIVSDGATVRFKNNSVDASSISCIKF